MLVVLAGWRITLTSAQGWAEGLRHAHPLLARSRASFAVQGPAQVDFRDKELAVDALLAALEARSAQAPAVLVVAHSSGAFVAATLFDRALRQGRAPGLAGRLAYVDLDGDRPLPEDPERSLGPRTIAGLRGALFVAVEDSARGLRGFSHPVMESEARHLGAAGHLLRYDASNAGCTSNTCAHLALVRSVPRATGNESYASTREGGANVAWMAPVERWLSP